ncbi:MAG: hypothetical protein GY821_03735 [Gammaproteobacteria bacterium]|nr:hypothetical protein [Gammaproteobacteria bacterium]
MTSLDQAINFYASPDAEPLPDVSASTTTVVTVHVEAKADGPDMDVASGATVYPVNDEDSGVEIDVGSMYGIDIIDDDDSELMGITITTDPGTEPLPDILIFNKGNFEGSTNSYTLTPDDYNMLTIQGVADFSGTVNLTVEATTVEKSNGDVASDSFTISFEILPTEDIDINSPGDITRNEARSDSVKFFL